jgi:N-terminal TM domain of oligopeptide transport permease C
MSAVAEPVVSFGTGLPTSAGAQTWQRLKRDRIALASGIVIALVLILCFVVEPIVPGNGLGSAKSSRSANGN